jgi:hypothetical protein
MSSGIGWAGSLSFENVKDPACGQPATGLMITPSPKR